MGAATAFAVLAGTQAVRNYTSSVSQGKIAEIESKSEAAQVGMQMEEIGLQSEQLKVQMQAEKTAGAVEELDRQTALNSVMAQQRAAFAASGLSSSSGSFVALASSDMSRAQEQSNIAKLYREARQSGMQANIAQLGIQKKQLGIERQQVLAGGKAAKRLGKARAIDSLLNLGMQAAAMSKGTPGADTDKKDKKDKS